MFDQLVRILTALRSYLIRVLRSLWKSPPSISSPLNQTHSDEPHYDFSSRMPEEAWDSHMHVTLPGYPLAADAEYIPEMHTLQDAVVFEKSINISNMVLVQPSVYGVDNSCLLDALRKIGPRRGRGVVCIDPEAINPKELAQWRNLGVRGIRINLKSTNRRYTPAQLQELLRQYADLVRPFQWVLELFIAMDMLPAVESVAEELHVKICIAHCGAPKLPPVEKREQPLDPYSLSGFQSLVNLVQKYNVWVKLSAAYRFDDDPLMRGIEAVATELIRIAPGRMVFASDWPHTRFEGMDVRPFVDRCLEWTEAAGVTGEVFCLNAMKLWDIEP